MGSDIILSSGKFGGIGFSDDSVTTEESGAKNKVLELMKEHFKPEFLNRIDEIIFFHALSEENIAAIVQLQIEKVSKRLKEQRKIELKVTERARKLLAEKGFDPQFGARPLKRIIQTMILDPLAMQIITGKVPDEATVNIDSAKEEIKINVKQTVTA